tara:strand:+ start:363 stop:557 length:195 start_codon:yes stop_codon:yes gene_type:complete
MKDYYSILGVPFTAELELIKSVYRSLSKIYHPDQYVGDKKFAKKQTQRINDTYAKLRNNLKNIG